MTLCEIHLSIQLCHLPQQPLYQAILLISLPTKNDNQLSFCLGKSIARSVRNIFSPLQVLFYIKIKTDMRLVLLSLFTKEINEAQAKGIYIYIYITI
jgi:hypothetical protein